MDWILERPSEVENQIPWGQSLYQALTKTIKVVPRMIGEFHMMIEVAKRAKTYKINGEAKDQEWIVNNRAKLESYMVDDMREHGYIPILDADTGLKWDYNAEKGTFNFSLEAKAYRVGKQRAKQITGIILSQGIALDLDGQASSIVTIK